MSNLINLLKSLLPSIASQEDRDQSYMADAVDVQDLERRMRNLDERGRINWSPIACGLYVR